MFHILCYLLLLTITWIFVGHHLYGLARKFKMFDGTSNFDRKMTMLFWPFIIIMLLVCIVFCFIIFCSFEGEDENAPKFCRIFYRVFWKILEPLFSVWKVLTRNTTSIFLFVKFSSFPILNMPIRYIQWVDNGFQKK
jgi:hypothetical protein